MSKAEQPSHLFDDKCKILFNYLPMPSYAWQIINEDDFILINYNQAAHEITKGTIEEFSKEKSNFFKEMKYNFKSGIEKYLSVNYGFIPPDIIVVLTKDITEKRKAEIKNAEIELELKKSEKELKKLNLELEQTIEERIKELKKSEQRYRLIAENVNDLIAILNEEHRYEYINEGIHNQQRGTSNELMIGTSPLDIVHPDEVEMNKKSFRKTLEEGEGVLETRIRNLWGGYNWFEVKGKTFIDVDGKKKVLLIARDINERKENELLLKQSERKYRHLFENSPYRIVLINTDGKIIDYKSATSNYGLNNNVDIIGEDFREFKFI
ncbi:MAG: PAS domain-containing protein, partial [Promethearchaeota archaeon]